MNKLGIDILMNKVIETKALEEGKNTDELYNLIKSSVSENHLKQWLKNIYNDNDQEEVGKLASLMEIHPLGFEKYVLWDNGAKGVRARLHYWPETKWPLESIHNHRFHFCATIICGKYTHEEYDVILDGNQATLELKKTTILEKGDTYFFTAGSFHRVIPSDELTISFIVRGNPVLPYSTVIDPDTLKVRRAYGALKKFKNKISSLEKLLEIPTKQDET